MKKSQLLSLGILVGLLLLYLILKSARNVSYRPELFVKIDTSKVDGIGIRGKMDTIRLKKAGETWQLAEPISYPVESRFVHELLGKLGSMEIEDLISEDPAKDSLFQVDQSGTEVAVLADDDTLANFLVGKTSDSGRHTYVRKAVENRIYLVRTVFGGQLNRKAKDWRDRVILDLPKESITRMDFQYPKAGFSLVKQDTVWTLEEGGQSVAAEPREVDRVLGAVAKFRTFDFVDGDSARSVDFSQPEFGITVTTEGGGTIKMALLPQNKEGNRYLLKKEGVDKTLFVIYKGSANALMKKADDFKKKPEPSMPSSGQK